MSTRAFRPGHDQTHITHVNADSRAKLAALLIQPHFTDPSVTKAMTLLSMLMLNTSNDRPKPTAVGSHRTVRTAPRCQIRESRPLHTLVRLRTGSESLLKHGRMHTGLLRAPRTGLQHRDIGPLPEGRVAVQVTSGRSGAHPPAGASSFICRRPAVDQKGRAARR